MIARKRLLLLSSLPLFFLLGPSFSSGAPPSLPEAIEFIRSEEAEDLPVASDSLMESSPYKKKLQKLWKEAYDGKVPDLDNEASLKEYPEELVAVFLKVDDNKKYLTILPLSFMRSEKDVRILRCSCSEGCKNVSCIPMEGFGGIICKVADGCRGSTLEKGPVKDILGD